MEYFWGEAEADKGVGQVGSCPCQNEGKKGGKKKREDVVEIYVKIPIS